MWTPDPSIIITAEQKSAEAAIAERKAQFPNLEPDQFWFVVRASGHEGDLWVWIDSHQETDPLFWAAASAKLDYAKFFERDHPFVEAAREALGLTPGELDDLWKFGAQQ
jgi:hypothetical protein